MTKTLTILSFIPIIFIVLLILFISTGIFVGIGYVISLIFPLTLFESSLLCMGSTFVVGFIILGIIVYDSLFGNHNNFDEEDDDEWDDDEDDDEDDEWDKVIPAIVRPTRQTPSGRVSRNAPCPCGSGKKYKYCCGKQSST